jgi:hypothetical protein
MTFPVEKAIKTTIIGLLSEFTSKKSPDRRFLRVLYAEAQQTAGRGTLIR